MERIKQALERAQTQRDGFASTGTSTSDRSTSMTPVNGAAPAAGSTSGKGQPVTYTHTRVTPIDRRQAARKRIVDGSAADAATAAYKVLRTQVLQRMRVRGWNALAITSSAENEGKTLTAINLAIGLAQESNHTVLLADFDLRNPSVLDYLGLESEYGVVDHLLRDVPLSEILVNPGIDSLVVMPGTERIRNSSELLSSPQTVNLVRELRTRYPSRILLFDLPPLLSADDALAFAPYVDAVLLVVEDGGTERAALLHALDFLADTPILGTVLNKGKEPGPGYGYY